MKGKKPPKKAKPSKGRRKPARAPRPAMAPDESIELSPSERGVAMIQFQPPPPKPRPVREIVEQVCAHIIEGDRIHLACSKEGITWRQLWFWKSQDADLQAMYAHAREASGESWEDKATKHVEDATADTVMLARLREDNARWRAKMANRKQYGDQVDLGKVGVTTTLEELVAGSMEIKAAG